MLRGCDRRATVPSFARREGASWQLALARIVSDAELVTLEGMKATGYPGPRSDYWCVPLSWVSRPDWVSDLSASRLDKTVQGLGLARGAPARVTWGSLRSL